jgi:ABC-2 type transport system permease protein
MRNYYAFFKKELVESMRTYKLLIMIAVFFIFGMLSPLTAKLLPQILASVMPSGMNITLAEPAAIDSWTQFFKNISQIGMIVTVILFSGMLANELSRGTLVNMLTKGLSRSAVIMAKFTSAALIWTISYAVAAALTLGYTLYLFANSSVVNLLFSLLCLWLFGLFVLSALMFFAAVTKSAYGALLGTGFLAVVLMVANIVPAIGKYNPMSLSANNVALLTNAAKPSQMYFAVGISAVCTVVFIAGAIAVFKKKQL